MAPRSARKRKTNEGDANAPNRRKKREDTPMKTGGGASDVRPPASGDVDATASLSLTSSIPERQADETRDTQLQMHLSFDPEDSQAMGSLEDSPSAEDLFPLMLETQYEGDEDAEEKEGEAMPAPTGEEYTAYEAMEEGPEGFTMTEEAKDEEAECLAGEDQGSQDGQDDDAEDDMLDSLAGASASTEEILQQLAEVAQNFITNFRELTAEGEAIQAELNQLNEAQDARCVKMLGRLERAGNSIFSFSPPQQGNDVNSAMETQTVMAESQETAV